MVVPSPDMADSTTGAEPSASPGLSNSAGPSNGAGPSNSAGLSKSAVPRLQVVDVSVRFDQMMAVDHATLSVRPGESVALVGPSGCGKSTLLRVIVGLQELSGGQIFVDGADITSVPTHRRGIGLMFQDHALFEHRSVADNIEFGLTMQKTETPTRTERVEELLDLVDLGGFGPRAIPTLSGGEAQRVALARSLAPAPSILLLDEPLGALDQYRRERLVIDLRRVLRAVDQTVLYVTHDLAEASVIGDRIAIMNKGKIVRVDTATGLWNEPRLEFVARFIGLNVMNLAGELVGLAPDELVVYDERPRATDSDDSFVTIAGAWFQNGRWTVTARSSTGAELRWTSSTAPPIDAKVVIGPAPGVTPRRLEKVPDGA